MLPVKLKESRKYIGYTLLRASELSNINPDMLYGFENGTQEPKMSQLSRLANIYKVSVGEFLSDKPIHRPKMLWCK